MKPLKKVGKSDPKGWQTPQDTAFPIVPEPDDDNELPVPYYDSDDYDNDSDLTHDDNYGDTDTDYGSDTGSIPHVKMRGYTVAPPPSYRTIVKEENDFMDE
jgi:hypothetical protein|tara:strand:- start:230 stop:532 length:303 start_codon:yes stop_codon:yes gene_type:complete